MEVRSWNIPALAYATIIVFTFLMFIASIPYGFYTVFYTHLSANYSSQTTTDGLPFYIGLVTVRLPISPTFGELFVFLTAIVILFLAIAAIQGGGFLRALKESGRIGLDALFKNPLSATIMILGASLLATVILTLVQSAAGVQTGGVSGDPLELLVSFVLSPFIEEVGYRFFIIGVPLVIVMLVTRAQRGRSLRALWRPSAAWEGQQESPMSDAYKLLVYLLIVVSSIIFGFAHYLANSGWDVGKISEAALDGVALAYLYMRYGLHASIIYHWAVDYASNAFAFYGQAVYGIPWTSSSIYANIPTEVILIFVGAPGLFYLIYRFMIWAIHGREPATAPEGEDAQPVIKPSSGTNADDSYR